MLSNITVLDSVVLCSQTYFMFIVDQLTFMYKHQIMPTKKEWLCGLNHIKQA